MCNLGKFWIGALAICIILSTSTGCVAQPQATQEIVPPPPATQIPKPSPLPPTAIEPPTATVAPSATPLPPTATTPPTLAPEEAVTKMEDVLGSWQFLFEGEKYLIQFLDDGFYNLGWERNQTAVDRGNYNVEGNILHFLTSPRSCPDAGEATYEAYVIKVDGKPVKLHTVLVGEDNCVNRNQSLNDKTLPLYNP